jgi:hypothetical protein
MKSKLFLRKILGYLVSLVGFVIVASPKMLHIPQLLVPWIFLGSIVWFVAFSSGVFSS